MKTPHSTLLWLMLVLASALGATAQDNWTDKSSFQRITTNEFMVLAAGRGDLEEVKRLLKTGVTMNGKDHRGLTAWQAAKIYGHKDVAESLRDKGADTRKPMPKPGQVIDAIFKAIVRTNSSGAAVPQQPEPSII